MNDDPAVRSIRSALVAVSDLNRSCAFYQDVVGLVEILREDQVSILGNRSRNAPVLFLREAERQASRYGQQELGVRMLCFELPSIVELDRVQDRLRSLDLWRDRQRFGDTEKSDYVRGRDPDGLPLVFIITGGDEEITMDRYRKSAALMYGLDL